MPRITTGITDEPLPDPDELAPECGARVEFRGVVRRLDEGRDVTHIVYDAHPDAADFLAEVVANAVGDAEVTDVTVLHRIGHLAIGDVALLVVVDAPHRGPAFALAPALVDALKAGVPIWKDQHFADGTHAWSALP
ncbi:molybdenum cofactor biosynthesis protein MoaE [Nanchangia anserum]|uniref:Molybdenum cofactor biosynthesis protein MoaE n=1 Tax=Nanchangia anserum TaxID=2692125 RepID=A0A8I0G741_9ACTO|nr:molybdenum cofactor biosynthesis protein MoaE [Nanchangia anserum]MBD3689055.1 molybdenum cofactor biosynthesis protein MoaE [Nanchangia anserum]QOX81297.1 molybdenum cofactor biosynthesis protein MoaE [Nanchangia anserum]